MKRTKRIITMLLCVILIVGALPITALAAYASVQSADEPASVQLYEYYSSNSKWERLSTPQHYVTGTNQVAYCLEHKGTNPHGGEYDAFDPTEEYPYEVYRGLYLILNWGYPAGGTGGLTADQARYATANAIRFWLSESQAKHGIDLQQWNFTNLARETQYTRPKSGDTAAAMWNYSMDLLNKARNGTDVPHSISVSPTTINMTKSGSSFVGSATVTAVNCNGGYSYSAPSGVSVSGYTGRSGDTLTLSVPTSMAGQSISITFTGKDNRSAANYAWYSPTSSLQKVVMVGTSMELPAVTTKLNLVTPDNGGIELYKTGDDGKKLAGAVFSVKNSAGAQVGTITTNANGYGTLDNLDPGTYYVQETKAPSGYILDTTVYTATVNVAETVRVNSVNKAVYGYINIQKANGNPTMGSYPLADAQFGVFSGSTKVDTIVTNAEGKGVSKALPLGTYTIKELMPPTGFVVGADKTVKLEYAGQTVPVVYSSVTIPNNPQVGKIVVQKTNGNKTLGDWPLTGAVFEVRDAAGTLVDTLTTDASGKATSKELPLGTYKVQETKAPSNFVLNPEIKTVVLAYGDQTVPVIYSNVSITDTPQAGQITVEKVNSNPAMGDYGLDGAVFEIVNESGTLVDTITTTLEGEAVSKLLPLGKYTVREKTAPYGFVQNAESYTVELTYAGQLIEVVYRHQEVPNKPQTGRVTITKRDKESGDTSISPDVTINGAVFEILNESGVVLHTLTAATDKVTSPELPLGKYIVREKTPPTGYTLNETEYPVTIEYAGQTVEIVDKAVTVENTIIRGRISIIKFNQSSSSPGGMKPLAGIEFTVTRKSTGEAVQTLKTDVSGYAITDELVYGTYTVTEVKGVEGHRIVEPFDVVVDTNGKVYAYALENEVYKSEIKIVKVDATTGEIIPAAGVTFKVKDADGNWIVQRQLYPTPTDISEYKTADDGTLVMPQPLVFGSYTLYEIEAGYGYILNEEPIPFAVDRDVTTITVECTNTPAMGQITVSKTGPAFTSLTDSASEYGKVYTPVYSDVPLEGAKFEIRAKTDIVTPDGTKRLSAGEVADTIITGDTGDAVSKPLFLGDYEVVEVAVPDGYLINDEVQTVSLEYKDQHTALISKQIGVRNDRPATKLELVKNAEQFNSDTAKISVARGEGFTFGLYAAADISGIGQAKLTKDMLLYVGSTDEDGRISVDKALPFGRYYFKELAVPIEYRLSDQSYPVELIYGGSSKPIITVVANDSQPILNELITGKLRLIKLDDRYEAPGFLGQLFGLGDNDADYRLEGAVFEVTCEALGLRLELTTNDKGEAVSPELPIGKYHIREIKAPTGFVLSKETFDVEITKDSDEVLEYVFRNVPTEVVLHKTDISDGKPLPGATIEVFDAEGKLVFKNMTDAKGEITIHELPVGVYTFRETSAPDGYKLLSQEFSFEIHEDGSVTGDTDITNEIIKVVISKVSAVDEKYLPGTTLKIKNSEGKTVFKGDTDENGEVVLEKLLPGTYTIKELKAPVGFILSGKEYTFTVDAYGNVKGTTRIVNQPTRVVIGKIDAETGDKLPGASVIITDWLGREMASGVTNKDGELEILYLAPGNYWYKEVKAPSGYVRETAAFAFTLTADETVTGDMTLKNKPVEVVITKTEITGKAPVPGATIEVFDANGKSVYKEVTDKNGQIKAMRLAPGKYTFKETLAPDGFALNPNIFEFEVTEDGIVKGTTEFTNEYVKLTVKKVDAKTGKTLKGAWFGLYDEKDKLLMSGETNGSGILEFSRLLPGVYKIRETKAPKGYAPSGKVITVTVTNTYVNQAEFVVENSKTVQTGVDGFPWWGYALVLFGLAGIAGGAIFIAKPWNKRSAAKRKR